jgi:hypothetical protein
MNRMTKSPLMVGTFIFCTLFLVISFPAGAADSQKPSSTTGDENESAQAVVEHETGFYYTVQKGDTLWDLSRKFSDTAWQWPELWQENKQIANPHRIYPGERIRLYRRKGSHTYGAEKELPPETLDFYYASIDQVGFIRKEPVQSHGLIYKVREEKVMINEGDIVYIRPENEAVLTPGRLYTVYRTFRPITDAETNTYIGIQHFLTGVVEILQQEAQYVIAKVIKSYRPIKIHDKLIPYNRRLPRITLQKSQEGIQGQVISGEEHQTIMGDEIIAFIDKGRKDGIKPGQFYSIYYQDEHRVKEVTGGEVLKTPVDFGELLVLHTENTTATVLFTRLEKEVEAGALVRTPLQ